MSIPDAVQANKCSELGVQKCTLAFEVFDIFREGKRAWFWRLPEVCRVCGVCGVCGVCCVLCGMWWAVSLGPEASFQDGLIGETICWFSHLATRAERD